MSEQEEARAEKARKKYPSPWWESDDPETIFTNQLQEEVLLVDFKKVRLAAQNCLKRFVNWWEFCEPTVLLREFRGEIPPPESLEDFVERYPKMKNKLLFTIRQPVDPRGN